MPKFLTRIVAFLLVASLTTNTFPVYALSTPVGLAGTVRNNFNEQALVPPDSGARFLKPFSIPSTLALIAVLSASLGAHARPAISPQVTLFPFLLMAGVKKDESDAAGAASKWDKVMFLLFDAELDIKSGDIKAAEQKVGRVRKALRSAIRRNIYQQLVEKSRLQWSNP